MISMELGPPPTSMGGGMTMHHDPSFSPHQESLGSDPGSHQEYNDDGMQGDSKRKRELILFIFIFLKSVIYSRVHT